MNQNSSRIFITGGKRSLGSDLSRYSKKHSQGNDWSSLMVTTGAMSW